MKSIDATTTMLHCEDDVGFPRNIKNVTFVPFSLVRQNSLFPYIHCCVSKWDFIWLLFSNVFLLPTLFRSFIITLSLLVGSLTKCPPYLGTALVSSPLWAESQLCFILDLEMHVIMFHMMLTVWVIYFSTEPWLIQFTNIALDLVGYLVFIISFLRYVTKSGDFQDQISDHMTLYQYKDGQDKLMKWLLMASGWTNANTMDSLV